MNRRPGPPKKPSALENAQGRPGHRPPNDQEPIAPALATLEPPIPLTPGARMIWDRDAPTAHAMHTLTQADVTEFLDYCRLHALGDLFLSAAENELEHPRKKTRGRAHHRPRPSPAFWASIKALEKANAIGDRFGLNPSGRSRIKVTQDNGNTDPLEALRQQTRAARATLRLA